MIEILNRLVDEIETQLRFRLTVEGSTPMDARIKNRPAFRLIGHAARVTGGRP